MKYGPNTERIEKILTQLKGLTPTQAKALGDAWSSVPLISQDIAQHAARRFISDSLWYNVRSAIRAAIRHSARNPVRNPVRHIAWNAILALLAQGRISTEHFDTLYEPWEKVLG